MVNGMMVLELKRMVRLPLSFMLLLVWILVALFPFDADSQSVSPVALEPTFVGTTMSPDEVQWIHHMCNAQCTAVCRENPSVCSEYCLQNTTRNWVIRCPGGDAPTQSGMSQSEPHFLMTSQECLGTCSMLENQGFVYVPPKPILVLVRDLINHSLTVSWTHPITSYTILYIVQESDPDQYENWSKAHLVLGDHYLRTNLDDVCAKPKYRVASVSRYGSRWFSDETVSPDLVPSVPQNLRTGNVTYDDNYLEFHLPFKWLNPLGWTTRDLQYIIQSKQKCPDSLDPVVIFQDYPAYSDDGNEVGIRVPERGIGCKIMVEVSAISRCRSDLISDRASLTIDMTCDLVRDVYNGRFCTPPPFNPPGNVQELLVQVVPGSNGTQAQISWLPPTDLGSEGHVYYYMIFYGPVDDMRLSFQPGSSVFNQTVSGDTYSVTIPIIGGGPDQTFGVMVMAGSQGQTITSPMGYITVIETENFDGQVLVDENGVIVYAVPDSRRVRVYWEPPTLRPRRDVQGVALQWGPVYEWDDGKLGNTVDSLDGIVYSENGREDVPLTEENFTVVEKDRNFFEIDGLKPMEVYGIKVMTLFNNWSDDKIHDKLRHSTELHVFRVPALPTLKPNGSDRHSTSGGASSVSTPNLASDSKGPILLSAIAIPIVLVVSVFLAVIWWCRWRKRQKKFASLMTSNSPEFRAYTYFPTENGPEEGGPDTSRTVADEWELPHSCIKVGRVLGTGAFGQVLNGMVSRAMLSHRGLPAKYQTFQNGSDTESSNSVLVPVAIKMLKEDCDETSKADFLREIRLMKELGHHQNVVSMLGCCTLREPYCLLVEHMTKGDLLTYLKSIRNSMTADTERTGHYQNREVVYIDPMTILSFARQIALGMEFLANKGFVHRDLAARNVLVSDQNQVKVGDFGLARYVYTDRVYVNKTGGKLPIKWMAIESIFDLTFSTASDVWSFGVVLFELVTLGGSPYPTLHVRDLLRTLKNGYRMERPDNCSEEIYRMMMACWEKEPSNRPTFTKLRHWLEEMIADTSGVQYLDMTVDLEKAYYNCQSSDSDSGSEQESLSSVSDHTCLEDCSETTSCCSPVVAVALSEDCFGYKSLQTTGAQTCVLAEIAVDCDRKSRDSNKSIAFSVAELPSDATDAPLLKENESETRGKESVEVDTDEEDEVMCEDVWMLPDDDSLILKPQVNWDDEVFIVDKKLTLLCEQQDQSQSFPLRQKDKLFQGLFVKSRHQYSTMASRGCVPQLKSRSRAPHLGSEGESSASSLSSSSNGESYILTPHALDGVQMIRPDFIAPTNDSLNGTNNGVRPVSGRRLVVYTKDGGVSTSKTFLSENCLRAPQGCKSSAPELHDACKSGTRRTVVYSRDGADSNWSCRL